MEAPKVDETKLVAPSGSKTKMVKVRALREVKSGPEKDAKTLLPAQYKDGKLVKEADVAEVTAEWAEEITKPYVGTFKFSGERPNNEVERHSIARAELVNKTA